MAVERIAKDVFSYQFGNLIECYGKLINCNCFEENLGAISTCIRNQQKSETQRSLKIKINGERDERLRSNLDKAYEKMTKFYSSYEDFVQVYDLLLKNNPSQFHNFVNQWKNTTSKSNCCTQISQEELSIEESECKTLLQDNLVKELPNYDQLQKKLESNLHETNEENRRLKAQLEAANEKWMKTNDLLNVERTSRLKAETERDLLTCQSLKLRIVFLKYEQHFSSVDKTVILNTFTNGKSTDDDESDSDVIVENEPDTDCVLEISDVDDVPSVEPPKSENNRISVREEFSSTRTSRFSSSLVSSKRYTLKEPYFECDICGESFSTKTYLRRHLQEEHKDNQPSNRCEQNDQFMNVKNTTESDSQPAASEMHNYNTRRRKEKTKSTNDTSFMMPETRTQTVINYSPRRKKKSSVSICDASDLHCDICEVYYSSKGSLYQHKRLMHAGVKRKSYKCSKCDKEFIRMRNLNDHESTHSSQRPFKCSLCDLSFKYSKGRARHERTVHGDGGVYCAYCDRKFCEKHQLIGHISMRHLPEMVKPYKCKTCEKSFSRKYDLKVHQAVHIS